jgi:hypothetical protein
MKTPAMANAVEVVLPFDNLSDPELHGPWLVCSKTKKQHDTMLFAAQAAQVLAAANMMLTSVPSTGRTESNLAA